MSKTDIRTFVEPTPLGVADFLMEQKPKPKSKPEPEREPEPEPTKNNPAFDMSQLTQLLPLLTGGGNQNDSMMQMLAPLLGGKKVGGMDVATMLPLLVNSGLLSKKETPPPESNKVININDYRVVK